MSGVLSILIPLTVVAEELPARSWHTPVTDSFAASIERTVGGGGTPHEKTGECVSAGKADGHVSVGPFIGISAAECANQ